MTNEDVTTSSSTKLQYSNTSFKGTGMQMELQIDSRKVRHGPMHSEDNTHRNVKQQASITAEHVAKTEPPKNKREQVQAQMRTDITESIKFLVDHCGLDFNSCDTV